MGEVERIRRASLEARGWRATAVRDLKLGDLVDMDPTFNSWRARGCGVPLLHHDQEEQAGYWIVRGIHSHAMPYNDRDSEVGRTIVFDTRGDHAASSYWMAGGELVWVKKPEPGA